MIETDLFKDFDDIVVVRRVIGIETVIGDVVTEEVVYKEVIEVFVVLSSFSLGETVYQVSYFVIVETTHVYLFYLLQHSF